MKILIASFLVFLTSPSFAVQYMRCPVDVGDYKCVFSGDQTGTAVANVTERNDMRLNLTIGNYFEDITCANGKAGIYTYESTAVHSSTTFSKRPRVIQKVSLDKTATGFRYEHSYKGPGTKSFDIIGDCH